jgi:CheY-like chemotaxis protein
MALKRALIVDDSKSARVILSRMLEKYDLEVDTAESAELAIEYLKHNRPDAIFMDHLMPGMDGLEAVRLIKANPQTAMIPIMMYTSQEGELYVGQARALGAMGVLPKQVRPVDVSKVLYELHLLPDRRDEGQPALRPVAADGSIATVANATGAETETGMPPPADASPPPPAASPPPPAAAGSGAIDWGRRLDAAIKEQTLDLRRFIVASLDSFAVRIISDTRDSLPVVPSAAEPSAAPAAPEPPRPWPWIAATAGCAAALFCALWILARNELAEVRTEAAGLSSANAQMKRDRQDLAETVKDLTNDLASTPADSGGTPAPGGAATPNAARFETVPYGEIPFDRSRFDALRELLSKLQSQGFRGVVRVTSLAGLFCLTGNAAEGYAPANAALPANKCDVVGNPFEDSLSAQQRQSVAFANLVASVRQRSAGAISVVIDNAGNSHATFPYPVRSDYLTAGEWNRAAAANNRVEFSLEPNPAQ